MIRLKVSWKMLLFLSVFLPVGLLLSVGGFLYFSRDPRELMTLYPWKNHEEGLPYHVFRSERPPHWVSLEHVAPVAQAAIVLTEDWSFYHHSGVDMEQLRIALEEATDGKRLRGASTITQQLVKNVWLTKERTLTRKFRELFLALRVDREVPKRRILELYLNIAQFGPGIFGILPAARHYFRKSPAELSPRESAFLAMLLPGPRHLSRSFREGRLTPYAEKRIGEILVKLRMGKAISPAEFDREQKERFSWELP